MKNKTTFNVECPYCFKRNLVWYKVQFDTSKRWEVVEECSKCGKNFVLAFIFEVSGKINNERK